MDRFTPASLAKCLNASYVGPDEYANTPITSYCYDSRKACEGALFAAIKGENVDGFDYIDSALERGALCVLCERKPARDGVPYILVPSVTEALIEAATYRRTNYEGVVIGIVGSVGKTSTKEMLSSVLSQHFCVHKTAGNHNNELGLPVTILELAEEHEVAVIEMGISDFAEMTLLTTITRPDIVVFTNVGTVHAEFMGNREGILAAKSEVFSSMSEMSSIFMNGDDELLSLYADFEANEAAINKKINRGFKKAHDVVATPCEPVFYGLRPMGENNTINDYFTREIHALGISGTRFEICGPYTSAHVHLGVPGEHLLYAAIASAAVADLLGLSAGEIIRGIHKYKPESGRSNIIHTKLFTLVDDCYNAAPESMRAALDMLVPVKGRRVVILGDMKELGDLSDEAHRAIGEHAADCGLECVLCVGEQAALIASQATRVALEYSDGTVVEHFDTVDDLLAEIEDFVIEGDTILAKASNSMHFNRIIDALITLGGGVHEHETDATPIELGEVTVGLASELSEATSDDCACDDDCAFACACDDDDSCDDDCCSHEHA